ncbi:MAG: hypothetical protein K0S07_178 [Chlamydiales bacterium]|jgi:predicted metal-dependent hydrolase|nr:hypothetical protein [Chlamydiales bacterium]
MNCLLFIEYIKIGDIMLSDIKCSGVSLLQSFHEKQRKEALSHLFAEADCSAKRLEGFLPVLRVQVLREVVQAHLTNRGPLDHRQIAALIIALAFTALQREEAHLTRLQKNRGAREEMSNAAGSISSLQRQVALVGSLSSQELVKQVQALLNRSLFFAQLIPSSAADLIPAKRGVHTLSSRHPLYQEYCQTRASFIQVPLEQAEELLDVARLSQEKALEHSLEVLLAKNINAKNVSKWILRSDLPIVYRAAVDWLAKASFQSETLYLNLSRQDLAAVCSSDANQRGERQLLALLQKWALHQSGFCQKKAIFLLNEPFYPIKGHSLSLIDLIRFEHLPKSELNALLKEKDWMNQERRDRWSKSLSRGKNPFFIERPSRNYPSKFSFGTSIEEHSGFSLYMNRQNLKETHFK